MPPKNKLRTMTAHQAHGANRRRLKPISHSKSSGNTEFAASRDVEKQRAAGSPPAQAETPTAAVARELRGVLATCRGSRLATSSLQVASTVALFALSAWGMWRCLAVGYWLSLLVALPTAGLLVRLFILQHDCGHGALFRSQKLNRLVGRILGIATMTPYDCWRRQHALHHAANGQLDHRGVGDVVMLTLREYGDASPWTRWRYRCYRHPLILFGFGPFTFFAVMQRLPWLIPNKWKRERLSIHLTNLLLALLFLAAAAVVGPWTFLMLYAPVLFLAASAGSWLFFVQHQFNPTYWRRDGQWDYQRAALEGSSFLDLPWPLSWFTANIGYHHIHHLDSRIPNYALPACHASHPTLQGVNTMTLLAGLRCVRLKLWDEAAQTMITFRQAKQKLQHGTVTESCGSQAP